MKYALLIIEDEKAIGKLDGSPAFMALVQEHMTISPQLVEQRIQYGGGGLASSQVATTVRRKGSTRTIHDGPFADTKEQLGGFYLIDVADLDAAIEVAKRIPLSDGGAIEIRPVMTAGE